MAVQEGTPVVLFGRVVGLSAGADRTFVRIRLPAGDELEIALASRPDAAQACTCIAGARRVRAVHLHLRQASSGWQPTAWLVTMVGRYRELRRPVPLAAMLALVEQGVPAHVRFETDLS